MDYLLLLGVLVVGFGAFAAIIYAKFKRQLLSRMYLTLIPSLVSIVMLSYMTGKMGINITTVLTGTIFGAGSVLALILLLNKSITAPLHTLTMFASEIATGDIEVDVNFRERGDEIGALADAFRQMFGYIKERADVAEAISRGDLMIRVEPRSDRDVLSHSYIGMLDYIKSVANAAEAIATGNLAVEVESKSNKDILSLSFHQMIKTLRTRADEAMQMAQGNLDVDISIAFEKDVLGQAMATMRDNLKKSKFEIDNIIKSIGAPMFVTDADLKITMINDAALKATGYNRSEVVGKITCADLCRTDICNTPNCTIRRCMSAGQVVSGEVEITTREGKKVPVASVCSALFDEEGEAYGGMEIIVDQTEQKETLREVACLIEAAKDGRLEERAEIGDSKGDYRILREGINRMLDSVVEPIREAASVLERVSERDLTVRMKGNYKGDYAKIKENLNGAVQNLDDSLQRVTVAAEQVTSASTQISTSSQALAQGASEQASSLQEVASSLQEMASMTNQNANSAKEARSLSESARESVNGGMSNMNQMSDAISKIKASSDETSKIIQTIDEIAFQTNLLALNAAVEAARAGDAGKGFAVVAEEVRNLAMRSAEAAKNTADMIDKSVKNAEEGVSINQEVVRSLEEIHTQANKVGEMMAEISAASDQQNQGVEQINTAVDQMNQVTQQNASSSQQSASAAEELSGQAEEMGNMVSAFRLSNRLSEEETDVRRPMSDVQSQERKAREKVLAGVGIYKGNGRRRSKDDPKKTIPLDDDDIKNLQEF